MLGDDVEPAVAESVLLNEIPGQSLAPAVLALRLTAKHQTIPGSQQPIAEVVVVAVAECFVQKADLTQRVSAIRRVARAHVPGLGAVDRCVSLLEIESHDASAQRRTRIGDVISLHRSDGRIVKRLEHSSHPTRPQHHILVDLTNNREPSLANAGVDRRRRSAPVSGDHPHQRRRIGESPDDGRRIVAAPIVDNDDLHRTGVGLIDDSYARGADRRGAVVHRHHEADASLHDHTISR